MFLSLVLLLSLSGNLQFSVMYFFRRTHLFQASNQFSLLVIPVDPILSIGFLFYCYKHPFHPFLVVFFLTWSVLVLPTLPELVIIHKSTYYYDFGLSKYLDYFWRFLYVCTFQDIVMVIMAEIIFYCVLLSELFIPEKVVSNIQFAVKCKMWTLWIFLFISIYV